MAQSTIFDCDSCGNHVEAWYGGGPYYVDPRRSRKGIPRSRFEVHVHHPDIPEQPLDGADVPHVRLDCSHEFPVDDQRPQETCTRCRSRNIVDALRLEGRTCPKCRGGSFEGRPGAIS
ncbi:MAG: hypothetical protein GY894_00025 [Planctomycetes bacterium]|nr:hypothetical protein [Planctomycetota bacterium]